MIRFLQPEWLWLLTVLPVVMLFRGRRGPVAAVEFSDVGLAREVARSSRARIGHFLWLLPLLAAALMIIGLARPQRAHSSTEVTANGIDIVLALAPESTQSNANVIALAMWRTAFGGVNDFGTGSAIAVFLFLLVIPVLALNIRRFKRDF